MNPIIGQIIIKLSGKSIDKKSGRKKNLSAYQKAKTYREFLIMLKRNIKKFVLIVIGIFSASFGFKDFLLTNDFIDGGATGISLLIAVVSGVPLYILKMVRQPSVYTFGL